MAGLLANRTVQGNERETAKGNEGAVFGQRGMALVSLPAWKWTAN
jgi:hypothetical protein